MCALDIVTLRVYGLWPFFLARRYVVISKVYCIYSPCSRLVIQLPWRSEVATRAKQFSSTLCSMYLRVVLHLVGFLSVFVLYANCNLITVAYLVLSLIRQHSLGNSDRINICVLSALIPMQGVSQAAMNLVQAATTEHRARGISGAVGGVLRQLPSSVMEPLVAGSEATVNLLDGVRNQLDPDSKRQTANKWRQEAT